MAAGSFNVFDVYKGELGGNANLDSVTFMGVIVSAGWTPALATDLSASANFPTMSAVAGQLSATHKVLTNTEWSAIGSNTYKFDFDDITFTYSVATASKYFVVYRESDNKLVGYVDLNTSDSAGLNATTLSIVVPTNGAFTI